MHIMIDVWNLWHALSHWDNKTSEWGPLTQPYFLFAPTYTLHVSIHPSTAISLPLSTLLPSPFPFFLIIITHWEERRTAANAGPCLISSLCCALLLPLVAPLFWPFPLSFFLQLLLAFLEVFEYWENLYWYFQNNISLFFLWLTHIIKDMFFLNFTI